MRRLLALAAGFTAALAIAGLPASASDTPIAANTGTLSWSPKAVTITAGDSVTWTTDGQAMHNVCVLKPGAPDASTCSSNPNAEFTNGPPATDWSGYTNSHVFATPGTYRFFCEEHKSYGMTGTITVQPASTGTGTTPPTDTQPTDTTPTQPTADTTPPAFTSKPKRRASRKALIVTLAASEAGKLDATVFRRPPHGHAFSRIGQASVSVKQGHNTVTLPRKAGGALRSGSYRIKLQLVDAAGNRSTTDTLSFKLA